MNTLRFFVAVLVFSLAGCSRSESLEVTIVIPKGKSGVFAVKHDSIVGEKVKWEEGKVTLTIPNTGLLLLNDTSFLYRWHETKVTYDNNEKIRFVASEENIIEKDEIACWGLLSTTDTHFYFLGIPKKKDEAARLRASELKKMLFAD